MASTSSHYQKMDSMGAPTESGKIASMRAALKRDWESGVIPISMMGLQQQTIVGTNMGIGVMQAVYLVQFGARATIITNYLALQLPISFATSLLTVGLLVGVSIRYSLAFFLIGCCTSLLIGICLTFPPTLYSDPDEQATFMSHYFGILFIIAGISGKMRDYPIGLARLLILPHTSLRATEKAYNVICDIMVGNGLSGALLLCLLANPSEHVKYLLLLLQITSTAIALCGSFVLGKVHEVAPGTVDNTSPPASTIGLPDAKGVDNTQEELDILTVRPDCGPSTFSSPAFDADVISANPIGYGIADIVKLTFNTQVWYLMIIDWSAGFIYNLNSQAAGAIYWSSIVGVSDKYRSIFIGIENALGGGLYGIVATIHATRLYYQNAEVGAVVLRIVACGAILGASSLACFGTYPAGAIIGIVSLYQYYYIFPWTNIEFLNLLDGLKNKHLNTDPLLYVFLIRDIVGGVLNNLRNMGLIWLLAQTGFYEPNCTTECISSSKADCVAQCHEEAHASITTGTTTLVRTLYTVVTPGAYLLSCWMIAKYKPMDAPVRQNILT